MFSPRFTLLHVVITTLLLSSCTLAPSPYGGPPVRDGVSTGNRLPPPPPAASNQLAPGRPLGGGAPLQQGAIIPANPYQTSTYQAPNAGDTTGTVRFPNPSYPGAYNNVEQPSLAVVPNGNIPAIPPAQMTQGNSPIPAIAAPTAQVPVQQNASAVQTLLNDASKSVAAGKLDAAASSLERAVRIEPRNAGIWHDLAQVRLHQRQYQQSESLAQKSISLAGANAALVKRNWGLIAAARQARGDAAGAQAATAKAQ